MKGALTRILGMVLIVTALVGMIFSLYLLYNLWRMKESITASLQEDVKLVQTALASTSDGLEISQTSIVTTTNSLAALQITLEETAKTFDATLPMMDTIVVMLDEDLPNTIDTAQTSLEAAQESAEVIDTMLRALRSIPFVSDDIYNPPVPLHEAFGQVSESLDPLPASLQVMEESLTTSRENLEVVRTEVEWMAEDLTEIRTSLEQANLVLAEYQMLISDLETRMNRIQENLPGQINSLVLIATFLLVWFTVAQLGMLVQGFDLLLRPREKVLIVEEEVTD